MRRPVRAAPVAVFVSRFISRGQSMGVKGVFAAVSLLFLASAAAWAQLVLRPGRYDVTMEVALPGIAPSVQQVTDCLTAEDAKDLVKAMLREIPGEHSCSASNVATTSNRLMFDAACTVQGYAASAKTEVVVRSDTSYDAVMKVTAAGVTTGLKLTGRWAGATCAAE
jgi:hypothetical protein